MSPTINDLRSSLVEATATAPAQPDRLAGVHRAVARRRHTRVAIGALTALAVAGSLFLVTLPKQRSSTPAEHSVTGIATYRSGGKLIGQGSVVGIVGDTTTFTIVPTAWGLNIADECSLPTNQSMILSITINGHPLTSGSCGHSSARARFEDDANKWHPLGVRLGSPSSVTVRVISQKQFDPRASSTDTDANSADIHATVGVYQDLPLDQYPLPTRPSTVKRPAGLGDFLSGPLVEVVKAVMSGSTGTWTGTRPYSPRLAIDGVTWAPGRLRVLVDGQLIGGNASWTYTVSGWQLDLTPEAFKEAGITVPPVGQPIEITVQADRFTDPGWQVTIGLHTT